MTSAVSTRSSEAKKITEETATSHRPDRIYRVQPDGSADVIAEDPDGVVLNQPTNLAFAGDDLQWAIVSSLGGWSLVAANAGVRGFPPLPHDL